MRRQERYLVRLSPAALAKREKCIGGKRKGRERSGETLVEILVSAFLFLLMMAVLQGAVSFCTNAQRKSGEVRDSNAEICRILREDSQPAADNGGAVLSFNAVSADGSQTGSHVFTIQVELKKKEISDSEGRKAAFYLFAPKGGGSP